MLKHCSILTLFPELFEPHFNYGVGSRAPYTTSLHNIRDFGSGKHRAVDDKPFGGGPGMLMQVEPVLGALEQAVSQLSAAPSERAHVVYLCPRGRQFDRDKSLELAQMANIVFICGRYEGIDQRLINTVIDEQLSIGPYVLSGGELPALVVLDALARRIPGVLGNALSAQCDSFETPVHSAYSDHTSRSESQDLEQFNNAFDANANSSEGRNERYSNVFYNTNVEHDQYTRPQRLDQLLIERLYRQRSERLRVAFPFAWQNLPTEQQSLFAKLCEVPSVLLSGDHKKIAKWRASGEC